MDKNRIKMQQFERQHKETLFSKINEVGSKQFDSISSLTTSAKDIGQSNVDIPNASTTLNNKIVELSKEFEKAGLSMFASKIELYDTIGSSFLGDAIIHDLIDQLAESSEKLINYTKELENITKIKNEQKLALQNISPMKKFLLNLRALFVPVKPVDLSLTEEEQKTLNTALKDYKDIDEKMWKYNLKDNLVQSLVKAIAGSQKIGDIKIEHNYEAMNVPDLLEENIIPDLKKLKLDSLIPQLQDELVEEYKKDLPDPKTFKISQEDMFLYIPNFKKYEKNEENKNEEKSVENRRNIRNGVTLKDFSTIDKKVSESSRRTTLNTLKREIRPIREISKLNDRKIAKEEEISLE